jgi:antitoxin FitA
MLLACYVRVMSAIQVKNVPEDLHDELRRRAVAEGKTVGEVILEALRRDLRRQSMREWIDRVQSRPRPEPRPTREQVDEIMREAKADWLGLGEDPAT